MEIQPVQTAIRFYKAIELHHLISWTRRPILIQMPPAMLVYQELPPLVIGPTWTLIKQEMGRYPLHARIHSTRLGQHKQVAQYA
jgi:hypothetical protein